MMNQDNAMQDMVEDNRRGLSRIYRRFSVEVDAGQGFITVDRTHDLSLRGMYLVCAYHMDTGTECRIKLMLGDPKEPLVISATCRVIRQGEDGVAVEFTQLDNEESAEHLHSLVMYNVQNPDQLEREIRALGHEK